MFSKVSVIGLGYVGLPTAAIIASKGLKVFGVDVKREVVEIINKGNIHIVESDLEGLVNYVVKQGNLKAFTKPQKADVYIVAVPTPLNENKAPDLTYIELAFRMIYLLLEPNNLIILESTSPVGTTQKMANLVFKLRPELKNKLFIAYCPERVLPGNILYELVNNDRIVGGINKESSMIAAKFYSVFVKGKIYQTNDKTAELCKLTENAFRDVNIAFANELSMICDKHKINVWELIELANKHPRVNILEPGPGVGGHCIAIDPCFIIQGAKKESKLIKMARYVNNLKPKWVLEKVLKSASKLKYPVIGCLGITYKANIDDIRESPSLEIVKKLIEYDIGQIMVCDPYVDKKDNQLNIKFYSLDDVLHKSNILLILVDHKEFKELNKENIKGKVVIDTRGLLR